MAEIEFTIPTVQYGNAKIRMTPEELYDLSRKGISLHDIGMKASEFLVMITEGFEAGKKIDWSASRDVTGQYQESSEPAPEVIAESAEKLNKIAEQVIKDELGATTVEPMPERTPAQEAEEAEQTIKTMLGATTVEPWTKTPAPSSTPKAWDNFDI